MTTLRQLCTPRASAFDTTKRDTALDLTDLLQERVQAAEFFEENFRTEGMKELFRQSFRRFAGKSAPGVIKLTQAMGGGKTHNLVALGLLARHPELRKDVLGDLDEAPGLGKVRVIGFTGRDSDTPLGIWGSLADQLGRREQLKDYYSPLSAPGPSAWIELLRGAPLLILLDELPPYFEAARATTIGHSDLSAVTTTALANLLVAVGKSELANVCVVVTDLSATYQEGSGSLSKALANFDNEVNRGALALQPVGLGTDELYQILRTRLFERLPSDADARKVAQGYAKAIGDARQMDITSASPETFAQQIESSYPFHPSLRDLYARFKENPGFQQTRGLIRLMRIVVSRLWDVDGGADEKQLIGAHDLNLNDRETLAELAQINPTLQAAISHDIASGGSAIAELIDQNLTGHDTRDAATLLLMASLANVPSAVKGLTLGDLVANLCAPGRNLARLKGDVWNALSTKCWYLHTTGDGKLFFKDTQNLQAKLSTIARGYLREQSLIELRTRLEGMFTPKTKDAYQQVLALPALDQIDLRADQTVLVISEPQSGMALNEKLREFYENQQYKNRVLILTGERASLDQLLERAAEAKAIDFILGEMASEKVSDNDAQKRAAIDLRDKYAQNLLSATRESFTRLFYPSIDTTTRQATLRPADFLMEFRENQYDGESQVRKVLEDKKKLTLDVDSDSFRLKCEARLLTSPQMPWNEVKRRAATNAEWQLHRVDALDLLRRKMVMQDQWRDEGDHVNKGPFAKPETSVRVDLLSRDEKTGEATLRLTAVHGDTIHWELGSAATAGSAKVTEPKTFRTAELSLSFLCVDTSGQHQPGPAVTWKNNITVKSKQFAASAGKMVELQAAPPVPIRYTTDGSDPRKAGGAYNGPFAVPRGTVKVLAVAQKGDHTSEQHVLDIDWTQTRGFDIDRTKAALWRRAQKNTTTKDSYEFLALAKKHGAKLIGPRVNISGSKWLELSAHAQVIIEPSDVEPLITQLRGLLAEEAIEVELDVAALQFESGQKLVDYAGEKGTELQQAEVHQ